MLAKGLEGRGAEGTGVSSRGRVLAKGVHKVILRSIGVESKTLR